MKGFILSLSLLFSLLSFSQMKYKFKQYMLHQMVFNPGFIDPETKYSVNTLYRRQWLRQQNYPEAFFVYGHYNINRNHAVGALMSNDLMNKFNQFEFSVNYVYNVPIGDFNLGLGLKAGFIEQNLLNTSLTYFDPVEPVLANEGNFTNHFLTLGTGVSLTSRNLNIHVGLPQLFGNRFTNQQFVYTLKSNHLFFNAGYKIRKSDWFIIYPNLMIYAVGGSKMHGSMNVNFLTGQLFWCGLGVDSELTFNASFGLFTQSGFRFAYTVDDRFFPPNQTTGFSHEVSLSYAKSIKDNPFSRRKGRGITGFKKKRRR